MKINKYKKKTLIPFILFLQSLQVIQTQDIITKRTGESLKAKVLEITPAEVKYRHIDRLEGPTYTLAKADVLLIQYEDSTQETFDLENTVQQEKEPVKETLSKSIGLYAQGQQDAGFTTMVTEAHERVLWQQAFYHPWRD